MCFIVFLVFICHGRNFYAGTCGRITWVIRQNEVNLEPINHSVAASTCDGHCLLLSSRSTADGIWGGPLVPCCLLPLSVGFRALSGVWVWVPTGVLLASSVGVSLWVYVGRPGRSRFPGPLAARSAGLGGVPRIPFSGERMFERTVISRLFGSRSQRITRRNSKCFTSNLSILLARKLMPR